LRKEVTSNNEAGGRNSSGFHGFSALNFSFPVFPRSFGETFLLTFSVKSIDQQILSFATTTKVLDELAHPFQLKRPGVTIQFFLRRPR
jgi:hypothetical protein